MSYLRGTLALWHRLTGLSYACLRMPDPKPAALYNQRLLRDVQQCLIVAHPKCIIPAVEHATALYFFRDRMGVPVPS